MSVNKVILVGNVGKDAEVRHLDKGAAVATFSLATSESYQKDGERITTTDWHNIVAWRGLAEFAGNYIKKGRQIYVEGRLKSRSYEDKDGVKKYVTEVLADSIQLLGKREADDETRNNSTNQNNQSVSNDSKGEDFYSPEPEDDLPF